MLEPCLAWQSSTVASAALRHFHRVTPSLSGEIAFFHHPCLLMNIFGVVTVAPLNILHISWSVPRVLRVLTQNILNDVDAVFNILGILITIVHHHHVHWLPLRLPSTLLRSVSLGKLSEGFHGNNNCTSWRQQ